MKQAYTFKLPKLPKCTLEKEADVKNFGQYLFDENLLSTTGADGFNGNMRENAFRFMTILDGRKDPSDLNCSTSELRVYKRIEELQKKKKLDDTEVWGKTVVFSSLALLWNIKQCADLLFEVSVSCDGTSQIFANDYHLMNFGCFSVTSDKAHPESS